MLHLIPQGEDLSLANITLISSYLKYKLTVISMTLMQLQHCTLLLYNMLLALAIISETFKEHLTSRTSKIFQGHV